MRWRTRRLRAHLDRMIEVMGELAVVEQVARMEGRNMFVILAPSREVLKAVAAEKAQKLRARAKAKSERRAAAGDNTGEVPALDDEPAEEADAEESWRSLSVVGSTVFIDLIDRVDKRRPTPARVRG